MEVCERLRWDISAIGDCSHHSQRAPKSGSFDEGCCTRNGSYLGPVLWKRHKWMKETSERPHMGIEIFLQWMWWSNRYSLPVFHQLNCGKRKQMTATREIDFHFRHFRKLKSGPGKCSGVNISLYLSNILYNYLWIKARSTAADVWNEFGACHVVLQQTMPVRLGFKLGATATCDHLLL